MLSPAMIYRIGGGADCSRRPAVISLPIVKDDPVDPIVQWFDQQFPASDIHFYAQRLRLEVDYVGRAGRDNAGRWAGLVLTLHHATGYTIVSRQQGDHLTIRGFDDDDDPILEEDAPVILVTAIGKAGDQLFGTARLDDYDDEDEAALVAGLRIAERLKPDELK